MASGSPKKSNHTFRTCLPTLIVRQKEKAEQNSNTQRVKEENKKGPYRPVYLAGHVQAVDS